MRLQRFASIMVGLSFFGVAVALWAHSEPEKETFGPPVVRSVQVQPVKRMVFTRQVRFPGITRAARRARLSFSIPARIQTVSVDAGRVVTAGDVIATLEAEQFQNALQAAGASLAELKVRMAQAGRDRRRIARLATEKAATEEELEKVSALHQALEAGVAAAEARLAETRRQVGETVLRAPFSGTITAVLAEAGEWAGPGRPVAEISGTGELEMEVEVPETVVAKIQNGQAARVEFSFAGSLTAQGRIVSVSRAAAGAGRLFPMLVRISSKEGLVAGMTAELVVQIVEKNRPGVPFRAIVNPGAGDPALFLLEGDRVRRINVKLGPLSEGYVAVSGGVEPGDRVVVAGQTALADGDQVVVDEESRI